MLMNIITFVTFQGLLNCQKLLKLVITLREEGCCVQANRARPAKLIIMLMLEDVRTY